MRTLPESIDYLKHIEDYQQVLEFVREKYEATIYDLVECSRDDQPKLVGKMGAYKEILDTLLPQL